jgi:ABC-type branched-subunit amino acid transport system substrate-binding protein
MLRLNKVSLLLVGAVALLALVAVACGGGEEEEGTQTPAATGTAAGTPRPTGTAAASATPRPTGTAAATATARPTATAAATATPQPTETAAATATPAVEQEDGVTDSEIILGSHFVQSGTWGAGFAPVLKGLQAYFNYVNAEKGGVCGRKIVLKAEDDQYDPALALSVTRKLVEQDKIFAMVAGLGTAAHSAVWDYLNEKGIPDLWVMAGEHMFNADPQAHPWTVPLLPDYLIEGTIFGKYISENLPGKKVGILYQNDDFGRNVLDGLKNGLDPTKNELISQQSYESTAIDIRSQVANIKQAGAEVAVCACIPGPAAQAIKGANNMGWKPQWFIDYVNTDPIMFLYASPKEMEGTLSLQANKLISSTDDPAVAKHIEIMAKYGNYPAGNYTIVGQVAGQLMEEVLNRSCDNLTRRGLMDAVESLRDFTADPSVNLALPGVTITITPDDHMATEAMRFLRAKVVDGKGVWEYEGELISFR